MMEKMKKNVKISLVLLTIAFVFTWFSSSFDEASLLVTDYWFIWIVIPIGLQFLGWFQALQQKAFNYGAKTSDKEIEKLATKVDTARNISKKRYDLLKQNARFTPKEAADFRNTRTPESIAMEKETASNPNFFIPMYRFERGLPGKNLVRTSYAESFVLAAKVDNGILEFYECEVYDYEGTIPTNKKVSEIPLGSIIKIEIIDLMKTRVLRKLGAHMANKMTKNVLKAVTPGVRSEKQWVDGARLHLHYVNEDGVVMKAEFVFPSNCRLGKQSVKQLSQFNKNLGKLELLGKIAWHSDLLPIDGLDEDDFDLDGVSALSGDMMTVLKWANLLTANDSAIFSAKLSAEMIAGLLLDDHIELLETTDKEENPS